jgi:hypothetical protein
MRGARGNRHDRGGSDVSNRRGDGRGHRALSVLHSSLDACNGYRDAVGLSCTCAVRSSIAAISSRDQIEPGRVRQRAPPRAVQ